MVKVLCLHGGPHPSQLNGYVNNNIIINLLIKCVGVHGESFYCLYEWCDA